ncbi:MAG: M56 family metallopeptidase [Alphaproteobacteria bacterium]|nr:M56 family metallopeptidase [Alphaproteobacteria bacterium]
MPPSFRSVWPKSTLRLQAGIAAYNMLGAATVVGATVAGVSAGLLTFWPLAIAGALTVAVQGALFAAERFGLTEYVLKQDGYQAPHELQALAHDLFVKAGLHPRFKPVVLLLDSRINCGDAELDYNAVVSPLPGGQRRNEIFIGVGHKTYKALTNDEITAVLAHEIGHIINKPPSMNIINAMMPKFAAATMLMTVPFFNPAGLLLAMSAFAVSFVCTRRASQLDEERADRASYGLLPDAATLTRAMSKMIDMAERGIKRPPSGLMSKFADAAAPLLDAHPAQKTRKAYAAHYAAQSAALHNAHNIPATPSAYATAFNQAAQAPAPVDTTEFLQHLQNLGHLTAADVVRLRAELDEKKPPSPRP